MEWVWTLIVLAILFGPMIFVFVRGRRGGAPSREDEPNMTGVTGEIRNIASSGRGPGGHLPPP